MSEEYPLISIVTPSLNQGSFLESAIRSVLDQNYPNLQYIIIDGGSKDDSISIIRSYEKHLDFWVSEKDRGQSHAINKGFIRSKGSILGWLNADDQLEPGALHFIAKKFSSGSSWIAGASRIERPGKKEAYIKRPEKNLRTEDILPWFINWFPQPSTFWSRGLWEKAGPLNESLHYVMDYDLWLKMSRFAVLETVPEILSSCRWHSGSKSYSQRTRVYREMAKVMRRHSVNRGLLPRAACYLGMCCKWLWDVGAALLKQGRPL